MINYGSGLTIIIYVYVASAFLFVFLICVCYFLPRVLLDYSVVSRMFLNIFTVVCHTVVCMRINSIIMRLFFSHGSHAM